MRRVKESLQERVSMSKKRVYLSGPISGSSWDEATEWRVELRDRLEKTGLYDCQDPLRGKQHLQGEEAIENTSFEGVDGYLTLFKRDRWDVKQCDIVFINLTNSEQVSIGSMFELAWAHELDKYNIVVMEKDSIHWHTFVHKAASIVFTDYDEAVKYMEKVLLA